jgi:RNA polymerase sigma-70 factor (ECF subfamily)
MTDADEGGLDRLVQRIAAGDRDAFARLYRECRPDVYRFAAHMSGSAAFAEDVVQDVFLAVMQQAGRYRPGGAGVTPWLLGIARNHVRRWKYMRIMHPLPGDDSIDGRKLVSGADPAMDLARKRHAAVVASALLKVPVRFREAIVLCDLQELEYEAAAAALGCPIGTIRSRLHRGRALLARELGSLCPDLVCPAAAAKQQ